MYKSLILWRDLTDKHLYQPGDTFPFDGRAVPAKRIAELMSNSNGAGIAVISPSEEKEGEIPTKATEAPKKPTRGRKKGAQ